jgi:hypothetical protein
MLVRAVDDKASDTLVVVSDEGFWTGSSTLPHLHHQLIASAARIPDRGSTWSHQRSLGRDEEDGARLGSSA